ncbi:bifunctional 23S rRNA (guanine(2069)-N(7))-methyltransferase RlmK/23S rRNA (guanine(2445)-N(2))-methyltransferase RlmL [Sinimarinibacterium sp. NLF-5-8]|uniref:bifunctional 23S rRNA (guanine(2069)-N(7))-methyltransferase RlmK/23S rRNA (guanine(2445)-N(2))-methyltransferase RlmL n=1 Tax=Sinimarinibacterium sp. NLF-5-8 TaxID=2698684 RepID=UPI00137BAAFF|nr:bifunctional 23S rRNA (guanine(2069)-N(7))-methyltransferase RlmK/23S rRNA (guanine(2445)-N(2))-methyltransferase RlmL [Sinimarinibacterium sp. NLF-5-8]QHS11063.1 bifunctional 23S rRNA (guanine(2069)-N(7))-methyltransferase RlmK/23S rRNA (guanine(2445)-N(2))-methyltransferase RlmL [Sinimarinibacterium sp. NLF-5-8]
MNTFPIFVTCPRGVETLLATELGTLGIHACTPQRGGVAAQATLEAAYRACLWSRIASRVLMPLQRFEAPDADALYEQAMQIAWTDIFSADTTFAIEVAGRSEGIGHTHFAGLKIKDAIVDQFRNQGHARPSVDTERPGIRIHLHLERAHATLSLDLAGDSLHRRGYRRDGVEAPLKENLASAILLLAGWPALAEQGAPLLDPLCGSGTLPIEAAWMAADIAPGILRKRWGFEGWLDHQPATWLRLREEAGIRRREGLARALPFIAGSDLDPRAIAAARDNAARAGLAERIDWQISEALTTRPPPAATQGLFVCNPPYGERLGMEAELVKLYSLLGVHLKQHFGGWRAAVFTSRVDLGQRMGLRADGLHNLYNGAIACKLLTFALHAPTTESSTSPWNLTPASAPKGGEDFANRLRKNLKHLNKWARRNEVENFRVYDADLPDYALAIDLYQTPERHAHVQEYAAPKTIEPAKAEARLREALAQLQHVLELPPAHLHYKLRRAQKGEAQYARQGDSNAFHQINEHGCTLAVNFEDYLDTGIFLDHRPLRLRIQREAHDKRVLNLFCYTGAASVHAAVGGARQTLSIDLSNTYLEWAQHNLNINGARAWLYDHPPAPGERLPAHALIRADCRKWLAEQAGQPQPPLFDLIFFDPPTFSNSKKMDGTLDIQRDHVELIEHCLRLLAPGGTLYFSNNRRGFRLDPAIAARAQVEDITLKTLDEDFKRPPPAHKAWCIRPIA